MRWLITLLLLVLVLAGGVWLVAADRVRSALGVAPPAAAPSQSLAVVEHTLRADQIREIKLTAPGHPALVLTRGAAGTWSQPGNWPLRDGEVAGLVNALTTLRSRFAAVPVEAAADTLTAYGLAPTQDAIEVVVNLSSAAGNKAVTLRFGRTPAAPGEPEFARPCFLRVDDNSDVVRLGPDVYPVLAQSPEVYRRRQLFPDAERVKLTGGEPPPNPMQPAPPATGRVPLLGDTVAAVKVEWAGIKTDFLPPDFGKPEAPKGSGGKYTLTRIDKTPAPVRSADRETADPALPAARLATAWVLDAEVPDPKDKDGKAKLTVHDRVDPAKLRTVLTSVADLWVEAFLPGGPTADRGLDKPERTITVSRPNGTAVTILIGSKARETTQTEPPAAPPMFGAPPPPAKITTQVYRYAKLKDNDTVFELRSDKLDDLFTDPQDFRDASLARFETSEVTELVVAVKGKPPVTITRKEGNKTAEKDDERQDRWYVGDVLAETGKVTELLDQLAKLEAKGRDNLVDNPDAAKLKELDIDPAAGTRVTVVARAKAAEGETPPAPRAYTFEVGKDDAEKKKLNVRVATAKVETDKDGKPVVKDGKPVEVARTEWPRINLVDDAVAKLIDRPALAYRGRRLFDTAEVKLDALAVKKDGADLFALAQKPKPATTPGAAPETVWGLTKPVQSEADSAKAAQLTGDLARLEVTEYVDDAPKPEDVDKKYGLAKPKLVVDLGFTGPGAKPRKLDVGATREGKPEVYARLDGGGSVFTVQKSVVDSLEQGAAALLPLQLWTTTSDRVTAIDIHRGEAAKNEAYKVGMVGTQWKLSGPFDAAASFGDVQPLLVAASNVKAEKCDSLTPDPAKHGLDKPALRVTVSYKEPNPSVEGKEGKEGKPVADTVVTKTLVVGNPTAPGAATRYARLDGGPTQAVYVIPDALVKEADRPALSWLDKSLLSADATQVAKVQITGPTPDANVTLTKDDKGTWKAEGANFTVDGPTVSALINVAARPPVARLAAYGTAVKWADFGLEKPEYTVAITLGGAKPATHTLKLGKVEGGERFVRVDDGPAVGVLLGRVAEALARGKLDFVDRTLLTFDPQALTAITRKAGKDDFEVSQAGLNWEVVKPAKQKADRQTIEDLADQLGRLRAVKVAAFAPADLDKPFGLKDPAAVITLAVGVDKPAPKVLKIGNPVDAAKPDGDRYAAADAPAGSPVTVGVIAGPLAKRLLAEPLKFRDKSLGKFVDADKVVMDRGDRKVTFAKVDGTWKLTEPVKADAEQADLDEFVNALANLRADELAADKPADLAPFGLKTPEATWKLFAGDKEVLGLLVGSKEKDGSRVYAKTDKGDLVALLDPTLTNRVLAEYRKRAIWTDLDASQVEALVINSGASTVVFRKDPLGWRDSDKPNEPVDRAKVEETLAALAGLKAERFVADKDAKLSLYGLEKPERVIVVSQKGGITKTLQLGGPEGTSGGKRVYAKVGDGSRTDVFLLSEADTAKLTRDRAAYLGKK
ncbi:DUF4340 domain-containing protein [Fimbriiglobus ruber]|uniref:DUF4340 domain-containing protein n=1 Tax=Fimbriiglobus ruber TaxID=1908690 RepID=A0A225DAF7_9BACT|nr:DUF4340 domain-containing protein [Fimbriiglobus ruber]OWK38570.1 hypothetical protein FRUB_07690 [Fimbriiglobus ruber]